MTPAVLQGKLVIKFCVCYEDATKEDVGEFGSSIFTVAKNISSAPKDVELKLLAKLFQKDS